MNRSVSDLATLLRSMEPELHEGVFVYASAPHEADWNALSAFATFREAEGITLITSESEAIKAKLTVIFRAAWITLKVHSDLQAVGLTAAFSRALGEVGISCNVVAAGYHDHIFVPVESAQAALAALRALQRQSA
jgi:uncharacterized protein